MSMLEGVGEFPLEVRRNGLTFAKYLNITHRNSVMKLIAHSY
jgi:hypothetical protein